jgi:hypothetical protein
LRVADVLGHIHKTGRTGMGSNSKKRTTMAKLNREQRLRERKAEKKAKKDARKQAPVDHPGPAGDTLATEER